MLNFFKKKKKTEPQDTEQKSKWHADSGVNACIGYYVKDGGAPCVDIELPDYSNESLKALCDLLFILGTDNFYLETLSVMKDGFLESGRDDLFAQVAMQVAIFAESQDKNGEGPCFKPSDVL